MADPTFSPEQLLAYDGSDAAKPVYIAVKGIVYDVSAAREFYGKGEHSPPVSLVPACLQIAVEPQVGKALSDTKGCACGTACVPSCGKGAGHPLPQPAPSHLPSPASPLRTSPGGPYEVFAGRECSRALAIMKVDASECNDNLTDISEKQQKTLDDWIAKFNTKYKVVGKVLKT